LAAGVFIFAFFVILNIVSNLPICIVLKKDVC